MKILALRVYVNSSKDSTGVLKKLLEQLFTIDQGVFEEGHDFTKHMDPNLVEQHRAVMIDLLDQLDLVARAQPVVALPQLSKSQLETVTFKNDLGMTLYKVDTLGQLIKNDDKGIDSAIRWNTYFNRYAALVKVFQGWKQLVEITLAKCFDLISQPEHVLRDLLMSLCFKITSQDSSVVIYERIEELISAVMLRIIAKLRVLQRKNSSSILDSKVISIEQYLILLRCNIQSILKKSNNARIRQNHYALLLNYLEHTRASLKPLSSSASHWQCKCNSSNNCNKQIFMILLLLQTTISV